MTNQEAIVWLKETKKHYGEYHEKADEALEIAINALEERQTGEWRLYFDKYCCSNCGTISKDITIYCSNCGAKMKID